MPRKPRRASEALASRPMEMPTKPSSSRHRSSRTIRRPKASKVSKAYTSLRDMSTSAEVHRIDPRPDH